MKTPPRKKRDELTMRELRDLERREEAERQEWDRENEARIQSLDTRTEIQQTIIDNIERDIHICKHKIDDMKEDFRAYERSSTFVDDLEELYGELGVLVGKRDVVKHFGFNEPLQTDTSHRNPSWVIGSEDDNTLSMDTDYNPFTQVESGAIDVLGEVDYNPFTEALVRGVLGEVDYDAQLDRLNKDL